MAKLFLVCMTAFAIASLKYFVGPVALKGMDIDFVRSMQPQITQPHFKQDKVLFSPPHRYQLPPPDLPPEPESEPPST